jgi:hypothetical protein
MKKILLSLLIILLFSKSNSQNIEFSDFDLIENLPEWIMGKISQINFHTNLTVDRTLNPFYLECDLNGDNNLDIALFVAQKETHKKGILIIHGKTFAFYLLGAGTKFGNGGDDYSWMKVWKIYKKPFAFETIFTEKFDILGNKKVPLKNVALQIAPSEGASNLIVWLGSEYKWIHTGD